MVAVNCEQVWQEISNYIDGEIDPNLRAALEDHVGGCQRCTAVLQGTRNLVRLYSDERLFQVPLGYSWRLQRRISATLPGRRGNSLGWLVAVAATALIVGGITLANSRAAAPKVRSVHAQIGRGVPATLAVIVNNHGKLFHVAGCPFLNEKDGTRTLTAEEAEHEGYVPCVRCMAKYLGQVAMNWTKKAWGIVSA
ncbi:MAG: zf-HC2 domain-containing protein [Acidobacteriia bacterium]|nr:zf-HC2 domain-containing protein [Terriglobia bacterium]